MKDRVAEYMKIRFNLKQWAGKGTWQPTECKVISAGINCYDQGGGDNKGCLGFRPSRLPSDIPAFFDVDNVAACPGTHICAGEGEICYCNGIVTFYPQIVDEFQVDAMQDSAYPLDKEALRRKVRGSVTCDFVTFQFDPAPYVPKACWCTPDFIVNELVADLETALETLGRCTMKANRDYQPNYIPLAPLREAGPGLYAVGEHAMSARRLASETRRRRTYYYEPWTYVEVGDHKRVCAYRFGASEIETGFTVSFKTPETIFGNGGGGAQNYLDVWRNTTNQCWLRPGTCKSAEDCAVAMQDPHILIQKSQEIARQSELALYVLAPILAFLIVCFCPSLQTLPYQELAMWQALTQRFRQICVCFGLSDVQPLPGEDPPQEESVVEVSESPVVAVIENPPGEGSGIEGDVLPT